MDTGKEVKNLDEINAEQKLALLKDIEKDETAKAVEQEKELSIAERMMRRAETNTFTITFTDTKNDDEIPIEFRLLYTQERRDLLKLISGIQDLMKDTDTPDIDKLNQAFDELKGLVKNVTITEGMNTYYDSEKCQDGDIFEIAMTVMGRTVSAVEQARSFREQ